MDSLLCSALPRLTALLSRVSTSTSVNEVLAAVAVLVEEEVPGTRCSLLIANAGGDALGLAAAPSLPAQYAAAVTSILIAEGQGGCGTAAARREPVIVANIFHSPLWADFLPVAHAHHLHACWSIPFFGDAGRVAGTLAAYTAEPREPTADELELLNYAALLAGIVVTRHRDALQIRESAVHFLHLAELSPDGIIVHQAGLIMYANATARHHLEVGAGVKLAGRTLQSLLPQQCAEALQEVGDGRIGVRWRTRAGPLMIVDALAVPVTFEGQQATLLVCRDMSSRVALERELLFSTEQERAQLAKELHEGIGQQLYGINLLLSSLKETISSDVPRAQTDLGIIGGLIERSIATTRMLAGLSSPMAIEHNGLSVALADLAHRTQELSASRIDCHCPFGADSRLDKTVATELYRIAQDGLRNTLRRTPAANIDIALSRTSGWITLSIREDASDYHSVDGTADIGLRSMHYRAGLIGATLTIARRTPAGTCLQVRLPVAEALDRGELTPRPRAN